MKISETIEQLRRLTQVNVQDNWLGTSEEIDINNINVDNLELMTANENDYLIWETGSQVKWLVQKFVIPEDLQGYPVQGLFIRLSLVWWAEIAEIFVNGKLVQEGDLFDSLARVLLTHFAKPGQEFLVCLRLVSPGHDIGALMKSQLIYESAYNTIDPGFVADEIAVLYNYLSRFDPEQLDFVEKSVNNIDWNCVHNRNNFNDELIKVRQQLQPLSDEIKQRHFNIVGHAHLDMAWLWTVDETWEVAERTFRSVINLQQEFNDLTFCHTTPVLYEWIENNRPDLFQQIQASYQAGTWEILGGMWVEPEVNLVSGESIVRQLLYGQKYIKEKFGSITEIAWLPDSFGFCLQLPQLFKQSGINYFVTGKLHWNSTVEFPHGAFWWRSLDGTQLLTVMSPPNVEGVMTTHPITMTNYSVKWEQQTGLKEILWIPGVGDHGGGPTRDMIEVSQRWQQSSFFPKVNFTTAKSYLDKVSNIVKNGLDIPVWDDELYLDLHRGYYTSHADQKYYNRRSEELLYQAELWSCLAAIIENKIIDNEVKNNLELAWKKVLFNQFHDILPGTAITDVFVQANKDWEAVKTIGNRILQSAFKKVVSCLKFPTIPKPEAKPIIIFNSLNWERSEIVEIDKNHEVYDLEGNQLITQVTHDNKLLFLAEEIPSMGYCVFWIVPSNSQKNKQKILQQNETIFDNGYLKVKINGTTGNIDSIYDKINDQEILRGEGNQLQSFRDQGQYWDAWNIDPNYNNYPLPNTELKSIETLETGPLRWKVRVSKKLGNSEFTQDYILQKHSATLKIKTQVNWQETYVLVKAAFPFNLTADYTSYEIPFGTIQRTNFPQTPYEKAKWEVPALRWVDLTDNSKNYGVSLLNDCKYGYDSQCDRLRLTLLKSPRWPDPTCDIGHHEFTYAIYPHQGSWQEAKTVQKARELNIPLQVMIPNHKINNQGTLPPIFSGLTIQPDNLIVSALKPAEDGSYKYILRCYECEGKPANIEMASDLDLTLGQAVNLLEEETNQNREIQPWKIASFEITKE
ncbi:putative alpha-mannosidase [Crocosphaera subtropica ATCC 51142]|uniref:Alpha-mannosidase n=1 Tax=Crocosphaera subtropica (strain ATCC 51142 / BH68) TaxID=43989 RepID=B1WUV2_CROS5|nr:alpha-mannosidase [Crocosphaera subtropica]ACB50553.1 putative alpha-mannosidase [Crocosphaera subtropica ATCC 51142]